MDLLAHFKPPLSSEQLEFKQKVEEIQVKCHMLHDKADEDITALQVSHTNMYSYREKIG